MPEAAKCADSSLHSACISEVRRPPIKGRAPLESTRVPELQQPDRARHGADQSLRNTRGGSQGGSSPGLVVWVLLALVEGFGWRDAADVVVVRV